MIANMSPAIVEFAQRAISVENESQLWTTSLHVSEEFEKQHKDVLRAIQNLECSQDFSERNFAPTSYVDKFNRSQPMYKISRDGWMLLTMGFTGSQAVQIKERWIAAFNWMGEEIIRLRSMAPVLPQDLPSALRAYAMEVEARQALELRTKALEVEKKKLLPKAQFFDQVANRVNGETVEVVAQQLGWGRNRLFKWLRDRHYLKDHGKSWNIPFQKYTEGSSKYFRLIDSPYRNPKTGEIMPSQTVLILGRGKTHLFEKLRQEGVIVPELPFGEEFDSE